MKKCCDTCIHKKVCDYWEKEAHPDDYGTYDGEPCIDYFPADVAPVVHGEWNVGSIGIHCYCECSICKQETPAGMETKFCPNCGADMRGEYKNAK